MSAAALGDSSAASCAPTVVLLALTNTSIFMYSVRAVTRQSIIIDYCKCFLYGFCVYCRTWKLQTAKKNYTISEKMNHTLRRGCFGKMGPRKNRTYAQTNATFR